MATNLKKQATEKLVLHRELGIDELVAVAVAVADAEAVTMITQKQSDGADGIEYRYIHPLLEMRGVDKEEGIAVAESPKDGFL